MARTRRNKEENAEDEAPEDPVATNEPSAEDAPGEEAEQEDGDDVQAELKEEKKEEAKQEAKEEGNSPTDAQKQSDGVATSAAAAAAAAIAARLVNKHEEQQNNGSKRAREGDEFDERDTKRTFDGTADDNTAGAPDGHGEQLEGSVTESLMVPATLVGKLIGRGGETIRQLQQSTGTNIQIDHASQGPERKITVTGSSAESVAKAKAAILTVDSADSSKTVECPQSLVGKIIGRGGETIRALQTASGARISVNQDFPPDVPREVVITGKPESVERAELMVNELIHGEPGSAQTVIQRVCQQYGIGDRDLVLAPKSIIGRIIGRGGETIKNIQKVSNATLQIDQSEDPCKISISGQQANIDQAKAFITEIMNGGDPFAPNPYSGGGGGYGQQQYGGYGGYSGYGAPGGYGGAPGAYGDYGGYGAAGYASTGYGAGGYSAGYGQETAAPGAGGQWIEYRDDQNRPYYYNTATGVTQWEKPPGM